MNGLSDKKREYLEAMKSTEFASLTQEQQAQQLDVARESISRWNREFPWADVFRGQLEGVGRRCGKVLEALVKKAEKGHLGATSLLFEILGVLKNQLTVKVETKDEFLGMGLPEMNAAVLREMMANPIYPGLDSGAITAAMKCLTLEEQSALREGVLNSLEVVPALDHSRNENISREFHGEGNMPPTENHA